MKKRLAIIRGGETDNIRSLKNGLNLIQALLKYKDKIEVVEVTVDLNNNWFEQGIPANPHKVFSNVDYYLDLTNNPHATYHNLAQNLKVKQVFADKYLENLGRVNLKRVLKQLKVATPKYTILRTDDNLKYSLKDIWCKLNTPLVIKEDNHKFNESSLLTHSFLDTYHKSRQILNKGETLIVEEFCEGKYISVGAIPNYRNQEIYLTIPIETLGIYPYVDKLKPKVVGERFLINHDQQKRVFSFLDLETKKRVLDLVTKLYHSLALNQHAMFDLSLKEKGKEVVIQVLDIHVNPNVFEDSRFDYVLKSSGVDLGELVLDRISKLDQEN